MGTYEAPQNKVSLQNSSVNYWLVVMKSQVINKLPML